MLERRVRQSNPHKMARMSLVIGILMAATAFAAHKCVFAEYAKPGPGRGRDDLKYAPLPLPIVFPKSYFPVAGRVEGVMAEVAACCGAVVSLVVGCGAVVSWGRRRRGRAKLHAGGSKYPVFADTSEGELEARNGSNFSRPVKPVSKHAN